jgi:hypothetical protein
VEVKKNRSFASGVQRSIQLSYRHAGPEKARAVAFIKHKSLSEIVRKALKDWLSVNIDAETELVLSEKDERRLLRILTSDEFIPLDKAKKSLQQT